MQILCLYPDFESKKSKSEAHKNTTASSEVLTPMTVGYVEKPVTVNQTTVPFENVKVEVPTTMPAPTTSLKRTADDALFSPLDTMLTMNDALTPLDEDLKLKEDELNSMQDFDMMTKQSFDNVCDTLPDDMDVNDIIFELQRQTVHSMMDELVNISDILAASQLDVYSNNETDLSTLELNLDDYQAVNQI